MKKRKFSINPLILVLIVEAIIVMGLYALVGRDDLLFVAPDNANPEEVFKGLKKFGM